MFPGSLLRYHVKIQGSSSVDLSLLTADPLLSFPVCACTVVNWLWLKRC